MANYVNFRGKNFSHFIHIQSERTSWEVVRGGVAWRCDGSAILHFGDANSANCERDLRFWRRPGLCVPPLAGNVVVICGRGSQWLVGRLVSDVGSFLFVKKSFPSFPGIGGFFPRCVVCMQMLLLNFK